MGQTLQQPSDVTERPRGILTAALYVVVRFIFGLDREYESHTECRCGMSTFVRRNTGRCVACNAERFVV